jgi:hypothetical protein
MFKAMIVLTRREDMTHAVVFNEVADGFDEAGIDGVAELWFDTREDFDAAYVTEIGKATAQDSLDHVSSRVRLIVSENTIIA